MSDQRRPKYWVVKTLLPCCLMLQQKDSQKQALSLRPVTAGKWLWICLNTDDIKGIVKTYLLYHNKTFEVFVSSVTKLFAWSTSPDYNLSIHSKKRKVISIIFLLWKRTQEIDQFSTKHSQRKSLINSYSYDSIWSSKEWKSDGKTTK